MRSCWLGDVIFTPQSRGAVGLTSEIRRPAICRLKSNSGVTGQPLGHCGSLVIVQIAAWMQKEVPRLEGEAVFPGDYTIAHGETPRLVVARADGPATSDGLGAKRAAVRLAIEQSHLADSSCGQASWPIGGRSRNGNGRRTGCPLWPCPAKNECGRRRCRPRRPPSSTSLQLPSRQSATCRRGYS